MASGGAHFIICLLASASLSLRQKLILARCSFLLPLLDCTLLPNGRPEFQRTFSTFAIILKCLCQLSLMLLLLLLFVCQSSSIGAQLSNRATLQLAASLAVFFFFFIFFYSFFLFTFFWQHIVTILRENTFWCVWCDVLFTAHCQCRCWPSLPA